MKDINRKIKIIIMWSVLILIYIFYVLLVEVIFGIGMQNPRYNWNKIKGKFEKKFKNK